MTKYLAPAPKFQAFDSDGVPLALGKVYTYASGGSVTPLATYQDSTGNTANTNPVILDSRGEANIWFTTATEYRIVLEDADGNTLYIIDNVAGAVTPSAYFATLMSSTQQSEVFDDIVAPGGTITGTVLMSGAAVNFAPSVTVASATSTPIGAAASNNVTVSGVATITSFDNVTAGIVRYVTFSGILTLTHNATSLILPTEKNITTDAGDTAAFQSLGSGNWRCLFYQTASGIPLGGSTTAASQAQMEAASSTTTMVTPGRAQYHPGAAKAWVQFDGTTAAIAASYNVTSVVRNSTGNYTITFTTAFSNASYAILGFCVFPSTTDAQGCVSAGTGFAKSTTSAQVATVNFLAGSYQTIDSPNVSVLFFGDQA